MNPDRSAKALRDYRAHLRSVLIELAERDEPLSSREANLIADAADARLAEVEAALLAENRLTRILTAILLGVRRDLVLLRRWVRRLARSQPLLRLRTWTHPRIGSLRHYAPKPLTVPAAYLKTRPPERAPSISIVTPSFEQGRFLDRTILSVVAQDYPALEYIVQDGGSTDETLDVLRRFEPALTRWRSESDEGQGDAINRGFVDTTGEIMSWLNSDDLLLPGALAYVSRYFDAHPNVDVVYGHRLMIDEDDGEIGAWILPAHNDLALTLADYIPQETLFWRRELWEAAGGSVDSSFGYALDWDLLLRFREAGATMVRLPRFLGAFRIHDEQKTTAANAVGVAECELLRRRVHGRDVSIAEVIARLRPYYRRHILVHKRHRLVERLPWHRGELVRTVPAEAWLRAAAAAKPSPEQRLDRADTTSRAPESAYEPRLLNSDRKDSLV